MRPHAATLDSALRDAGTPAQLLEALGQPALAQRLPAAFGVADLVALADHEAARRRHRLLDREHVVLAAARVCDDTTLYDEISASLTEGAPRRGLLGWRPRSRGRSRPRDDDSQ